EIDALLFAEFGGDPVDNALIDVVATEVGVTVGRFHLDDTFADFEHGNIEGAAAEVVDGDRLILLLVEAVSERRGRRLVDDALHFKPGDAAGVLGRLALRVVKVGGNRDDGVGHLFSEVGFGGLLELSEDHRGDFGRRILLAHDLDARVPIVAADYFVGHHFHLFADFFVAAAHEALNRKDGVFGIGNGLALGDLPYEALATLGEGNHRRSCAAALLVRDHRGLSTLHDGHNGVCGPEIDSYDFAHTNSFLLVGI